MFDTVKKTDDDFHGTIRDLNRRFCAKLPEAAAKGGEYQPQDGDALARLELDVPDGTYRLVGSDWFYIVKNRRLARAALATRANKYGGPKVILVPPVDPPPPSEGGPHGQEASR